MATVDAAAPSVAKPANVKKTSSKPKKPAVHPPFAVMIVDAVKALKERSGSSRQALIKYICANYTVDPALAQTRVRMALKKLVEAKNLVPGGQPGKKGAGCYKLAAEMKLKKVAKKTPSKKPAAKKAKTPVKKAAAKAKKPVSKKLADKTNKAKSGTTTKAMVQKKSAKPKDGMVEKAAKPKTAKLVAAAKVKASKAK